MEIAFDPNKEAQNRRKHGFDFSLATWVLSDPLATTVFDRFEDGEQRWRTYGAARGKVLVVVHTLPDDGVIRVIGLRLATVQERKQYEEDSPY